MNSVEHRWTLGLLGSSSADQFLTRLDKSISRDIHKISCGLWDQNRPIIVVTNKQRNLGTFLENRFAQRHPHFKMVSPSSRTDFILQSQYLFWKNSWTRKISKTSDDAELFKMPSFDLNGYKIALTFMPSNLDNINYFINKNGKREYFGIMHEIAATIAASLNATFSLQVPPDEKWGAIDHSGSVSALFLRNKAL